MRPIHIVATALLLVAAISFATPPETSPRVTDTVRIVRKTEPAVAAVFSQAEGRLTSAWVTVGIGWLGVDGCRRGTAGVRQVELGIFLMLVFGLNDPIPRVHGEYKSLYHRRQIDL